MKDQEYDPTLLIKELTDNLIWCSGSNDFGQGGIAQIGWDNGPRKTIDKALNYLKQLESA